jgi:hypothetical protein
MIEDINGIIHIDNKGDRVYEYLPSPTAIDSPRQEGGAACAGVRSLDNFHTASLTSEMVGEAVRVSASNT